MFRNLAYDVTTLMKAAQDLKDEHALDWGQRQVTTKVASVGDQGDSPSRSEVNTKPLSEAESQIRAFMKEVSAWILECKAWDAEYNLDRAKNTQARTGTGNLNWGCQNHNNGQGQAPQCQPTQRSANENGQDQNSQENATLQNQLKTQSCQQHEGSPPMWYKCCGWGQISCNCPSTQNYTQQA